MSGVTKATKLGDGDLALLEWMKLQPEGDSALIKLALYNLMEQRSKGGNIQTDPNPAPPGIDLDLLKDIIDYAIDQGAEKFGDRVADKLAERLEGLTFPIPLNETKKKKEPEQPEIDADRMFADAMAGFDSWGN